MSIELSIIIVNWNSGDFLRRCVESIARNSPSVAYEIVIVDNASSDDSLSRVTSLGIPEVRCVRNTENAGFGKACNQAFALTSAPFIFLLNPDTEVTAGAIDTLLGSLSSDSRIGACGPRLLNADGSVQVTVWHCPHRVWEILLSQLKLYLLLPQPLRGEVLLGRHWRHDRKRTVPMLGGAAIMARREMIDAVGGFDERFHVYGEDNEWCWRIRRAGWQLVFEPAASFVHYAGQSATTRWTHLEKLRVQLEAEFMFEAGSMPRWRLVGNQLAHYSVDLIQKVWRRVRGIRHPEIELKTRIHREHLRRSLGLTRATTLPESQAIQPPGK